MSKEKRLLMHWKILQSDLSCKKLFDMEHIIAYSKQKSINILIKSRLQ